MVDVIIIGGGTAGLTASIYAKRAGMECLVFESDSIGGKIINSPRIDNYPALPNVSGYDYSMSLFNQATDLGVNIKFEKIIGTDLHCKVKKLYTKDNIFESKTVIIANGSSRKRIGCMGEKEFEGKGVSYCSTCDGNFFKNKDVSVVGGGDTAIEDAIYLSNICNTVYVFSNKKFTAREELLKKVEDISNIILYSDCSIMEIKGDSKVNSIVVQLSDLVKEFPVSAVFGAVGLSPDNSIFGKEVELDKNGYIIAGEDCHSSLPGVFAAGDTRSKMLRQLVTAASDGAIAATEAFKFIKNNLAEGI